MKNRAIIEKTISIVFNIEQNHPYLIPFFLAVSTAFIILFYTAPIYISDMDYADEVLQFVDLEMMDSPARTVNKEVSALSGDSSVISSERAMGTADMEGPVDISFYPDVAVPRPVGKLRKIYPKIAREQNIDATVNVELLIAPDGKVQKVSILAVRISKTLPADLNRKISGEFASAALQILLGAQFSPPVINGKRVPVKMELPLNFRMDEA